MRRALTILAVPALAVAEPESFDGLTFHAAPKPLPAGAVTEDWPHFLGPHHNATTKEDKLLEKFPAGGLKVVWEITAGDGYTSPVFAAGKMVYFHRVDGKETVECLDPETGKRYWKHDYPVVYRDRYGFSPGPRASAVIDDGRVYTAGVTAIHTCLDLATGKVLWQRDLRKDFSIPQYFFGFGPTPFLWKDRLIVNAGGKGPDEAAGASVVALDKLTGRTLWEHEDAWGASYASPLVTQLHGKDVALVVAAGESRPAHGGLLVLDPMTGRLFDRFPWRADIYESVLAATPLVVGDNRVLLSDCYEKGGVLLEFDASLKAKPVWTERWFGMHWMVPLLVDGHLYGFAGRNPPDTQFKCADLATGEIQWENDMQWRQDNRVHGFFRASLLQARKRVFCLGEDGAFAELELSPEGPVIKQRVRLFTAREAWVLPALHRGLLYVSQNTPDSADGTKPRLICYDLRGG